MPTERSKRYPTREAALADCITAVLAEPEDWTVHEPRVWQFNEGATSDDRNRWTWMFTASRSVNDYSNQRPQDRQKLVTELLTPTEDPDA